MNILKINRDYLLLFILYFIANIFLLLNINGIYWDDGILVNSSYEDIYSQFLQNEGIVTMRVREYNFQIPCGIVNVEGANMLSIEEKPVYNFFVNGGVYTLDSKALDFIPDDEFYEVFDA